MQKIYLTAYTKRKARFPQKKTTFFNINEWSLKKLFTTLKIWYWNNKPFLRIKLQFVSGDVFQCSLYRSRGLSMSQLSHDRLPFGQKFAFSSSHYTSGLHPRFALLVCILPVRHFAVCSPQITKPDVLLGVAGIAKKMRKLAGRGMVLLTPNPNRPKRRAMNDDS